MNSALYSYSVHMHAHVIPLIEYTPLNFTQQSSDCLEQVKLDCELARGELNHFLMKQKNYTNWGLIPMRCLKLSQTHNSTKAKGLGWN